MHRPRQVPMCMYEYKKLTNAKYKYAIHFMCKNEQAMTADFTTKKLLSTNVTHFWKVVKAFNSCAFSI